MSTRKKTIAASLAGLTLSLSLMSVNPTYAHYLSHPGYRDYHGGWGPGLAIGIFGLAAGAVIASQVDCVRYRPIFDADGNYVGRQAVNIC
jgi:hypothetical protein